MSPALVEGVAVDADSDWDEEAIANAIKTAHQVEGWDPELAKSLMAQAQAAKMKRQGTKDLREPYDPMRTRARLLISYKGGLTDEGLDRMDFRRYLGYIRELDLYLEEQNEQRHNGNTVVEAGAAFGDLPRPQEYTGETIRLI